MIFFFIGVGGIDASVNNQNTEVPRPAKIRGVAKDKTKNHGKITRREGHGSIYTGS